MPKKKQLVGKDYFKDFQESPDSEKYQKGLLEAINMLIARRDNFLKLTVDTPHFRDGAPNNITEPRPTDPSDKYHRHYTMYERQFYKAMDQLERLQRRRKGDSVPAPINVDVRTDT
jgi:hypothetical protein